MVCRRVFRSGLALRQDVVEQRLHRGGVAGVGERDLAERPPLPLREQPVRDSPNQRGIGLRIDVRESLSHSQCRGLANVG